MKFKFQISYKFRRLSSTDFKELFVTNKLIFLKMKNKTCRNLLHLHLCY